MNAADVVVHAHGSLPLDIAVLCADCGAPVPLVMFVDDGRPKRQVGCPGCTRDVVLKDAW